MHSAAYIIWLGLALLLVSWIWLRHPGKPFWFQAPPWRAAEFLRPAGVWLQGVGFIVGLSGIVWFYSSKLFA